VNRRRKVDISVDGSHNELDVGGVTCRDRTADRRSDGPCGCRQHGMLDGKCVLYKQRLKQDEQQYDRFNQQLQRIEAQPAI